MKIKVKNLLLGIIMSISFNLTACSNSSKATPRTVVTLTEAGAERINHAIEKQTAEVKKYAKYASWLSTPLDNNVLGIDEVNPGDEVTEDMIFEVYPSDNLDKMFLVGRTTNVRNKFGVKSVNENITPLINITTNIPEDELSDYSLNGQVSYINGSGDINHDKINLNNIPYQEDTELTMTYSYIKKGTSANSSPYSCQPSFHLIKVDNEAPTPRRTFYGSLYIELSYTLTPAEIRSSLVSFLDDIFIVNDSKLEKIISILKTDEELAIIKSEAIDSARLNAPTYNFLPVYIPFKVSTENASTNELNITLQFIDDVEPAIKKGGSFVSSIMLNGGTNLKLPHITTLKSGVLTLLTSKGYVIEDEISPDPELNINIDANGYLMIEFSYNRINRKVIDQTTKFNWGSGFSSDDIHPYNEDLLYYHVNDINTMKLYYSFDPFSEDYSSTVFSCSELEDNGKRDIIVIDDLVINKNSVFEEKLMPKKWYRKTQQIFDPEDILIINSSIELELDADSWFVLLGGTKVFINFDIIKNRNINMSAWYPSTASNIYTSSAMYDKSNSYFDDSGSEYDILFFCFIPKGTLNQIHYNYSLDTFKADFGIYY